MSYDSNCAKCLRPISGKSGEEAEKERKRELEWIPLARGN
jgi:hypothetical protein